MRCNGHCPYRVVHSLASACHMSHAVITLNVVLVLVSQEGLWKIEN